MAIFKAFKIALKKLKKSSKSQIFSHFYNISQFQNELFEGFLELRPGGKHFYLGEMMKLLKGKSQMPSIPEPLSKVKRKICGRTKGAPNKRKRFSQNSSKRDPSGLEYVEVTKRRGRQRKHQVVNSTTLMKRKGKEDHEKAKGRNKQES